MTEQIEPNSSLIEEKESKTGILLKKSKSFWVSGWKEKYFVLTGGSLYYYEKVSSGAARGVIQLQTCKIVTETNEKRKYVIGLQNNSKLVFIAAKTESEYNDWLSALTINLNFPPSPPPEKFSKPKEKMSSTLLDTATNIQAVRKLIKEHVSEDTFIVMNSLKSFVSQYDSPDQAEHLEMIALMVGSKVALLYKEKKVSKDYFMTLINPLHKLCDKLIDSYEIPFTFNCLELVKSLNKFSEMLEKMLKPHLNEKTLKALVELLHYFAKEDLLSDFFTKKKWKEAAELGTTLRRLWDSGQV